MSNDDIESENDLQNEQHQIEPQDVNFDIVDAVNCLHTNINRLD